MNKESRLNWPVREDAEALAIQALSFLAGRPAELERFLALSGIDASAIRRYAPDPAFFGGILDFLLGDEALLIAFAEENGCPPAAIGDARHQLDARPSL